VLGPTLFGFGGFVDGLVGEKEVQGDVVFGPHLQILHHFILIIVAEILVLEFLEIPLVYL